MVLNNHPFNKDMEARLGILVRLANDANCCAVAEALMGAVPEVLSNADAVFGVILGTGVGGGWVLHGKVRNERQGI
jgi:predicted NBD/HSP70 family sugar kinase